jgi:drug/metabolite transporter (DMT)-like permease
VLWSLSSFFIRLLSEPTRVGVHEPKLDSLHIALFRSLFSGLVLIVLIRPKDVRFRPAMPGMVLTFAIMTGLYLSALNLGPAANAILLQNTAPVWVCLFGWLLLGERTDRRTLIAVLVAMVGGAVIVVGNWPKDGGNQALILLMAAGSGVMYAGVILFLRQMRDESAAWLTMLNLVGSGLAIGLAMVVVLGPTAFAEWVTMPTGRQLLYLALFGTLQMALPYWLFSRGLKSIGPQEAGIITLLEPLLNPVWAYMIAPDRDTPTPDTWLGGAILLGAMAFRYARR